MKFEWFRRAHNLKYKCGDILVGFGKPELCVRCNNCEYSSDSAQMYMFILSSTHYSLKAIEDLWQNLS